MAIIITPEDLAPFATIDVVQTQAMIDDALAMATMVAPCLSTATDEQAAVARAILRRAILRWNDSGVSGAVTQRSAGPFSESVTSGGSKGLFWPSEITALQDICKSAGTTRGAFTIKPAISGQRAVHDPICDLVFFGPGCTCGSNLNRYEGPIFNGGTP